VISMYKWQQVTLLKEQGLSIKKIARKMQISKNTVRKYVRNPDPPTFKRRHNEKMLDGYREKIQVMINKGYIGTRIFNELMSMGYKGSLSTLHRYVRGVKKDEDIKKNATTRIETPPGKQMQYDWKEWALKVNGKAVKIYIHGIVLGYSRKKYYTYSVSITGQDIIRAIAESIEFFGGIPEQLLMDNAKQMVITHKKNGTVRYHDEFLKFCGLYGIEPNACENYWPRTKGKVEKPFYYIQEHLLRGLEVDNLSELDPLLKDCMDSYNARAHSTLKQSPDTRFLTEKNFLHHVPFIEPTMLYERQIRKVSNDGYISYKGKLYPVPMRLSLREVMVEDVFGRAVKIYASTGEMVKQYPIRLSEDCIRPEHPEHEQVNQSYLKRKESKRSLLVETFIDSFSEIGQIYLKGLRQRVGANIYWHLEEIVGYAHLYTTGKVLEALSECIKIGAYHKNSVKMLLEKRQVNTACIKTLLMPAPGLPVNIERDLSFYRMEVAHA